MSFARIAFLAVPALALVLAIETENARPQNAPEAPPSEEIVRKVRLSVRVEGDGRDAYLEIPLPVSDERQTVLVEKLQPRGFRVEEVERDGNRLAILSHPAFEGRKRITYEATVRLRPARFEVPEVPVAADDPPREEWKWLRPTRQLQSASPLIREKLIDYARPRLAEGENDALRICWDLVKTGYRRKKDGSKTVLKATRTGHAAPKGMERLLATFLRTSGVPSRPVHGVDLGLSRKKRSRFWVEVKVGDEWIPMSVSRDLWGELPAEYLKLAHGDRPLFVRDGIASLSFRWRVSDLENAREVIEP